MTIEWDFSVPETIRNLITEGVKIVTCGDKEKGFLIVRMERIYLQGIFDGLLQAQRSTADALSKIGTVR